MSNSINKCVSRFRILNNIRSGRILLINKDIVKRVFIFYTLSHQCFFLNTPLHSPFSVDKKLTLFLQRYVIYVYENSITILTPFDKDACSNPCVLVPFKITNKNYSSNIYCK